jgi:hypothetical protein
MAAQKKSAPRKLGRPTKYTPELAAKICDLIREGLSEREICSQKGMPDASTLGRWKDSNQDFCIQSARAREESAALYREKALQVAQESADVAAKILRGDLTNSLGDQVYDLPRGYVEAQKLLIQELNREAALRDDRNYGDRRRVAVTGADGGAVKIETKQVTSLSNEELLEIARMEFPENEGEDR